ncbi:MAG: hypothetical protein IT337_09570 [Thermomicrobiales bacterium]|nr:hypothetical protein [Thermomicrobiales bacterium]
MVRWLPLAAALALAALPLGIAHAQESALPCDARDAPGDGLQTGGLGLTRPEMDDRFGPGEAAQSGWMYALDGATLEWAQCDLIVLFPEAWQSGREPGADVALVESLLPADAVLTATWPHVGVIASDPQIVALYASSSLAERYALLGEVLSGNVLVVYTYANQGYEPGPILRAELRPGVPAP